MRHPPLRKVKAALRKVLLTYPHLLPTFVALRIGEKPLLISSIFILGMEIKYVEGLIICGSYVTIIQSPYYLFPIPYFLLLLFFSYDKAQNVVFDGMP